MKLMYIGIKKNPGRISPEWCLARKGPFFFRPISAYLPKDSQIHRSDTWSSPLGKCCSHSYFIDFIHILGAKSDGADRFLKKCAQSAFLGPGDQNGGQIGVKLPKSLLIWWLVAKNLHRKVFSHEKFDGDIQFWIPVRFDPFLGRWGSKRGSKRGSKTWKITFFTKNEQFSQPKYVSKHV